MASKSPIMEQLSNKIFGQSGQEFSFLWSSFFHFHGDRSNEDFKWNFALIASITIELHYAEMIR